MRLTYVCIQSGSASPYKLHENQIITHSKEGPQRQEETYISRKRQSQGQRAEGTHPRSIYIFTKEKKKNEEGQVRKAEFNKLIKDHLKYNKKIVMTLMNHKVEEESKSFKEKLSVYLALFSNSRF